MPLTGRVNQMAFIESPSFRPHATNTSINYRDLLSDLLAQSSFPPSTSFREKLGGRELVLFGAGEGIHLFVETAWFLHGHRPSLVLDRRFRTGDNYFDVQACSPDNCNWSYSRRENALVVLTVGNPMHEAELRERAISMGFRDIVTMMSVYEVHQPFMEPRDLEEDRYVFFKKNAHSILRVYDLLHDEESKAIYYSVIRNHCSRRPDRVPMRPKDEHNLPRDLPFLINYGQYVCCGYSPEIFGNTIRNLGTRVQRVLVVDPMISSFDQEQLPCELTFVPCALDSQEAILNFTSISKARGNTFGCRILPNGETYARATRLDTIVGNMQPTFISMDIEGAELKALSGAIKTLIRSKPTLALCTYHSVDHIWKIPELIDSLNLGYRFWLRNYSSFCLETVLYATPNTDITAKD